MAPHPPSPAGRGPARRWRVGQLVPAVAFVAAALGALAAGAASVEATAVAGVVNARGWSGVSAQGPMFVVWSGRGVPTLLEVTWSCSALVQVAAVGGALLVFGTSRGAARWLGVAMACALVVVGNLARLTATVWLAATHGESASLLWHDWAGTALTLVTGAAAIALGAWSANRVAERRPGPVAPAAG